MVGDGAVACGVHVWQVRLHAAVDRQRAACAGDDARRLAERGVGSYPDHDEDEICAEGEIGISADGQAASGSLDRTDERPGVHLHAVPVELAEFGSTVGSTESSCSTIVTASPSVLKASVISSPM